MEMCCGSSDHSGAAYSSAGNSPVYKNETMSYKEPEASDRTIESKEQICGILPKEWTISGTTRLAIEWRVETELPQNFQNKGYTAAKIHPPFNITLTLNTKSDVAFTLLNSSRVKEGETILVDVSGNLCGAAVVLPNQIPQTISNTLATGMTLEPGQYKITCQPKEETWRWKHVAILVREKENRVESILHTQRDNRIYHPRGLEIDVVYGCNIKCPQCSHCSQFQRGYLPVNEFAEWSEAWAKRIRPYIFIVIGGEPLLHPNIVEIIAEAKRIWYDSKVGLYTNGSLPHRITPELLKVLNNVEITISVKPYKEMIGKDYAEKIHESISRYQEHDVIVRIRNNPIKKWMNDPWTPLNSPPDEAFKKCWTRKCAQPIYKGKLYRCLAMMTLQKMYEIGKIDWKDIMNYKPLDPDCSDIELKTLIEHKNPCAFCRFCNVTYPVIYKAIEDYPVGKHIADVIKEN